MGNTTSFGGRQPIIPIHLVAILIAFGLAVRLLMTPFLTYLRWDAIFYMIKAFEIAQGHLTPSITWAYGWPALLSLFYLLFRSDSVIINMAYLRLVCVLIGTVSLIPMYLIAKRILRQRLALVVLLMGAFCFQMVVSSHIGYSEALYTLLLLTCIYFILKSENQPGHILLATVAGALMYYVRINGFIILPVILGSYIILRHNQHKKAQNPPRYEFLAYITLLFLTLSAPMLYQRSLYLGSMFNYGVNNQYLSESVKELFCPGNISTTSLTTYLANHTLSQIAGRFIVEGLVKMLSDFAFFGVTFVLLPFFIYGICAKWKNRAYQVMLLAISVFLITSIPIWKIFGTPRYFYPLVPLVIIISVAGISELLSRLRGEKLRKMAWAVVIAGYLIFSVFILVNNYYLHYAADRQELNEGVEFTAWIAHNLEGKIAIVSGNDLLMLAYNDTIDCRERMGNYYCSPTARLNLTTYGCHDTLAEAMSAYQAESISYLAIDDTTVLSNPFLSAIMDDSTRPRYVRLIHASYNTGSRWKMAVFWIDWDAYESAKPASG